MVIKNIPDFDLDSFSIGIHDESDRACAVLGPALLDARLEKLFLVRLGHNEPKFLANLINNRGPLSTFSARIDMAFALRWIDSDVHYDLNLLRKIRNDFAHSFDHELSFSDDSIASKCRELRTAKALLTGFEAATKRPGQQLSTGDIRIMASVYQPARARFVITVEFIAQYLVNLENPNRESTTSFIDRIKQLSEGVKIEIRGSGVVGV